MANLKELREKKARIATNAQAKFNEIKDDTTAERAAEIEREVDAMLVEAGQLEVQIARGEQLETLQRSLERGDDRRPQGGEQRTEGQDGGNPPTYRDAFHAMLRAGGDMTELSAEHRAALRAGVERGAEFRAQTVGTNSAGGYTVPTELQNILIQTMAVWGPMYDEDICTSITTASGNVLPMPTVDDTGVAAVAHTEGVALTDDAGSDVTFGQKQLEAYAYDTEFVKWSMELAADSIFNVESLLGSLLGERLGRIANAQLTVGTGSSQPNGIVTAAGSGKVAASTSAITADEILDLVHSVDPAYRVSPKARAMFNDSTLLALRKLKDGDGNYLLTEAPDGSGRLRVGAVSVPYSINQAMLVLGGVSRRVMVFGDFSKYFVRKVGSPVLGVMRERFWPDLGIAGLIRIDGELGTQAAVKALLTAAS